MAITNRSSHSLYWVHLLKDSSIAFRLWPEETLSIAHKKQKNPFNSDKIKLNKSLVKSLNAYAKEKKINIQTLYHTAWGILLSRYSSNEDITYGTGQVTDISQKNPCWNINSLFPVRIELTDRKLVIDVFKELDNQLNNSLKQLKKFNVELLPDRKHPYYFLTFKSKKQKSKKMSGAIDPDNCSLMLVVSGKNLDQLELVYSTKKFTSKIEKNLLNHYCLILNKIISDQDQLVTHFSILTKKETTNLLYRWNKPKANYKILDDSPCFHDLFSKQAELMPQKIAVTGNGMTLTYRELDRLVNQLAIDLLKKQVKPADKIAVLQERSPILIVAMIAIFKIGAIYVPMNPKNPSERTQFTLEDCDAALILTDDMSKIPNHLTEKTFLYTLDDLKARQNTEPSETILTRVKLEDIAYIIYTSGTTGQPKGVMIKHVSLLNFILFYQSFLKVNKNDRSSQFASQSFDSYFCETVPFLACGGSVHIVDDQTKLSPQLFLPWLAEEKITICDLPTSYAQILFTLTWPKNISVRMAKIGGENMTRYPTQVLPFDIWNIYGPTETTIEATFMKIYKANTKPKKELTKTITPSIGKPMANAEIYVVDKHLQPVPAGIAGELLIGGLGLAAGYLNRQQLTREKFIRNIFTNDPNAKLYRTGDLVKWDQNGCLDFLGRIDHQVKVSGYRIELSEIESILTKFPDVSEVVMVVREVNQQKTLAAYVVPNIEKIRIPYQERCMIDMNNHLIELITEDFSKEGIAVAGLQDKMILRQPIRINLKLPGMNGWQWLTGQMVWQQNNRGGILIDKQPEFLKLLNNSVTYHLSSNNLMDTLLSSLVKRNLRKALAKKLPNYMIPSVFNILTELPRTLNGKVDLKALPPPQDFQRLLERNYVPPRTETEKAIAEIWVSLLNHPKISMTDNFFDLGGTSLIVSQLSIQLLKKFNLTVPTKILFDLPFIPILAEYVDSNGSQYTESSSVQDVINHDAVLSETLLPHKKTSANLSNPEGILLTGAGGFLGVYLLNELLKKSDSKIYCLIRKGEFETAAKRLISTLANFRLDRNISLNNRRIIVIDSDLGHDKFGMSPQQYDSLASKIDSIYHCGAQVNTMASYTHLRNSNVLGTLEVLKFATHKIDKPVHYVSTLSSAYKLNEHGEYDEEYPDAHSTNLVGGYAISKWVSERLLTQIKNRGLPISIFRSGYILGDSETGITSLNDALLLLIKGCLQLGYAPDWNEQIAILPVDFVSKAIVEITFNTPGKSGVYHLDHPQGIMWVDLVNWLNNYGYKIKLCSHKQWLALLKDIHSDNALYHFLPYYLSLESEPKTPRTSITNTTTQLKKLGIPYPEINDELLGRYMDFLCEKQFLPTPDKVNRIKTTNNIIEK